MDHSQFTKNTLHKNVFGHHGFKFSIVTTFIALKVNPAASNSVNYHKNWSEFHAGIYSISKYSTDHFVDEWIPPKYELEMSAVECGFRSKKFSSFVIIMIIMVIK